MDNCAIRTGAIRYMARKIFVNFLEGITWFYMDPEMLRDIYG